MSKFYFKNINFILSLYSFFSSYLMGLVYYFHKEMKWLSNMCSTYMRKSTTWEEKKNGFFTALKIEYSTLLNFTKVKLMFIAN
jgi:hypothetical protein